MNLWGRVKIDGLDKMVQDLTTDPYTFLNHQNILNMLIDKNVLLFYTPMSLMPNKDCRNRSLIAMRSLGKPEGQTRAGYIKILSVLSLACLDKPSRGGYFLSCLVRGHYDFTSNNVFVHTKEREVIRLDVLALELFPFAGIQQSYLSPITRQLFAGENTWKAFTKYSNQLCYCLVSRILSLDCKH